MRGFFIIIFLTACLLTLFPDPLHGGVPYNGSITPGFGGTQMNYINNDGIFLESINKDFGFGFVTTPGSLTLFTLSIIHRSSSRIIWSANRAYPVSNSDKLQFQDNGNVVLRREEGEGGAEVWRLDNSGKNASRIELRDSGNLVVVSGDETSIWESFNHPTDTLITNQVFKEGMKLTSNVSTSNMTYVLEMKLGDMFLSVNSLTPQVYWSMGNDSGRIVEKDGVVTSSSFLGNSWRFFDEKQSLLWQFLISNSGDDNATWIAVLGNNGVISFTSLGSGVSAADSSTKIPNERDQCATPETCGPYYLCSVRAACRCLLGLSSVRSDCKTGITSPCNKSENNATLSVELVNAGERVDYFALGFASPFSKETNLDSCKELCSNNCSCLGLFFQNSSGNCFLFDWIGSFKRSPNRDSGVVSYVKVATTNGLGGENKGEDDDGKHFPFIVIIIVLAAIFTISVLIFAAFRIHRRMKARLLASQETHSFVNILPGTAIRFSYKDLQLATRNFSAKLGQGGFGSVFKGTLPDGSHIAVKQLEGIGQGKKEFKAEVSTIGSIHHQNLVHLTGFCEEGAHRLLVYEYLPNGSLERWIFKRRDHGDILLDWDARFNIAVGTAKGLAYLHEDCDARIIHCDIKPENILLDDDFNAKVSDFGLAKLMTREQSHVFTTLRGTRGYMAPEWITTYAISEKSDVYSYGMVLIEIIRRRKNQEGLASSNFPAYAFKRMREGLLIEDVDWDMEESVDVMNDERVSRAMKTAFWCIQEDMDSRPSMSRVVQMLEGVFPVVQPPSSSTLDPNRYKRLELRSISEESGDRTSSSLFHSELSGPR